jgi:hypothetical protein
MGEVVPTRTGVTSASFDHFNRARRQLLVMPVNIILFPMEGDPWAAPAFWDCVETGGSMLAPSEDWP